MSEVTRAQTEMLVQDADYIFHALFKNIASLSVTYYKRIVDDLEAVRREVQKELDVYNFERLRLLNMQLADEKMAWCTKCRQCFSQNDMKQLYIETRIKGAKRGSNCFRQIHYACNDCYRIASEGKSGWNHGGVQYKVRRIIESEESHFIFAPFGWLSHRRERILKDGVAVLSLTVADITQEMVDDFYLPPSVEIVVDEDGIHIHIRIED